MVLMASGNGKTALEKHDMTAFKHWVNKNFNNLKEKLNLPEEATDLEVTEFNKKAKEIYDTELKNKKVKSKSKVEKKTEEIEKEIIEDTSEEEDNQYDEDNSKKSDKKKA